MGTDNWCTPPEVADPLEQFFGGPVDLDPCSNARSIIRAVQTYRAGGLHLPWAKTNFENPPYGRLDLWTDKGIYEIVVVERVRELVRLVPVATSTGWWRRAVAVDETPAIWGDAHEPRARLVRAPDPLILFTKRIAFLNEEGMPQSGARFDSVLFYYGKRREAFRREFKAITSWEAR
jgi:hypothetical protein